jgi:hypothetical protein
MCRRGTPGTRGQAAWQKDLTEADGLNWLDSFGAEHGKPLTLPEWGLGITTRPVGRGNVGGGDDPYFVNQIAGFIADNDVIEAGLWDYQGQFFSSGNPGATTALIKDF